MSDFNFISLLQTVLSLLGALAVIVIVILVHELGHFSVARWCGVKIERFSLGFGKILWSCRDKQGTEYAICLLPLGGYVKMLGEGSEAVAPPDRQFAFNQKSLWARAAIVFAGPL
ncbi:MAG TPA: site-2 protease family protein, partial [Coxiellaceae bacterium]|nr:site-2 protease family protein [Coxiellaceae bacterium]